MKSHFFTLFLFAAICGTTIAAICGTTIAAEPSVAPANSPAQESAPKMSRNEFAKRFAKIKEGMSADAVVAILGQPDDIRTDADPDGIFGLARTSEIWGYGVDRHLGFATRATITIDDHGKVQYSAGTKGADEPVERLGEPELQRLLRLLADVPPLIGSFDPQKTIAAVNALQPLGEKTGCAVMREYCDLRLDLTDDINSGMFAVMRILFVPPTGEKGAATQPGNQVVFPGYFREPGIAASDWQPADPRDFPAFPIALVDDIPLVITHGTGFGGAPETPGMHLDKLEEEKAAWRKEPLHPKADPLSIIAKIESRCPREQQEDSSLALMIQMQLLRLLDSVYRPANVDELSDCCDSDVQKLAFAAAVKQIGAIKVHWDAARSCYAREDGSILPALVRPMYRRNIFAPKFKADPGFEITTVLARESSKRLGWNYSISTSPQNISPTEIKVVQLGKPDKILFDKTDRESKDSDHDLLLPGSSVGMGYSIAAGERFRIEITHGKEHFISSVFEP